MRLTKQQVQKAVADIQRYAAEHNENIVFCGPKIGGEKLSERLRVYAHGGGILEIGESGIGKLNRDYGKYAETGLETAEIIAGLNDGQMMEWLADGRYLDYAVNAANNRYSDEDGMPRERNIQTQILQRYAPSAKREWFFFDMEFAAPKTGKWSAITGKPDLVCFDGECFGIVELKYRNKSVENIEKHYDDFKTIIDEHDLFAGEMVRRLTYLRDYGVIGSAEAERAMQAKDKPIRMGFLFVNETVRKTAQVEGFLIPRLEKCGPDFRYMCTESIDAIADWQWKTPNC